MGTERILLGLVREGEGMGPQVLVGLGVDLGELQDAVVERIGAGPSGDEARDAEPSWRPLIIDVVWRSPSDGDGVLRFIVRGTGAAAEIALRRSENARSVRLHRRSQPSR